MIHATLSDCVDAIEAANQAAELEELAFCIRRHAWPLGAQERASLIAARAMRKARQIRC